MATEDTSNIIPFLRYADAPAAIKWLSAAFGFKEQVAYPSDDGGIAHAVMSLGPGMIMLGSARPGDPLGMKTPGELGAVNQGIYVHVPEIDDHYERAKAAGAEMVLPITDMEYGSREYTARDLEGNLWSFGTYHPGQS